MFDDEKSLLDKIDDVKNTKIFVLVDNLDNNIKNTLSSVVSMKSVDVIYPNYTKPSVVSFDILSMISPEELEDLSDKEFDIKLEQQEKYIFSLLKNKQFIFESISENTALSLIKDAEVKKEQDNKNNLSDIELIIQDKFKAFEAEYCFTVSQKPFLTTLKRKLAQGEYIDHLNIRDHSKRDLDSIFDPSQLETIVFFYQELYNELNNNNVKKFKIG